MRGVDGRGEGNRILLLEDEADVRELFHLGLRTSGYVVEIATTIAQALQRLAANRYDLVITDLRLPDGDGLQVADRAADLGSKTFILSGYLFHLPAGTAERHDLLMKPIRPRELIAAVERAIGSAKAP
jgi:two-component system response regulator PilR (NtrC family)